MVAEIRCYLTIGMLDNEQQEYTLQQQDEFIKANHLQIETAANEMMQQYIDEDELDELDDPDNDFIREYLYEHVTMPTPEDE